MYLCYNKQEYMLRRRYGMRAKKVTAILAAVVLLAAGALYVVTATTNTASAQRATGNCGKSKAPGSCEPRALCLGRG